MSSVPLSALNFFYAFSFLEVFLGPRKRKENTYEQKQSFPFSYFQMTLNKKTQQNNNDPPRPCRGLSGVHIMCTDDGWMDGQQ